MEKSKKIISIIVLAALLALSVVGVYFMIENNIKTISTLNEEKLESGVSDENGDILDTDKVYPMPKNLIFSKLSSTQTGSPNIGVMLSASVLPVDAWDLSLDWQLSFNSNTELNINEHISLEFEENDTLRHRVRVRMTDYFDVPITLKASSSHRPTVYATTQIDCYQTPKNVKLKFVSTDAQYASLILPDDAQEGAKWPKALQFNDSTYAKYNIEIIPSEYNKFTVMAESARYSLRVNLLDSFISIFNENITKNPIPDVTRISQSIFKYIDHSKIFEMSYDWFLTNINDDQSRYLNSATKDLLYQTMLIQSIVHASQNTHGCCFSVTVRYYANEGVSGSKDFTFKVPVNFTSISKSVQNVDINNDNIVFY